jgi:hypothetical protein
VRKIPKQHRKNCNVYLQPGLVFNNETWTHIKRSRIKIQVVNICEQEGRYNLNLKARYPWDGTEQDDSST